MNFNHYKTKLIERLFVPYFLINKKKYQNCILMYHGVSTEISPYNKRHTLKKHFIQQIAFLKKYCNIISLEDYFDQKFVANKLNIALTFDDGYWNNFNIAKPILEEAKIPAHFFITGINQDNNLNKSISPILWADFIEIAANLKLIPKGFKDFEFKNEDKKIIDIQSNLTIHQIIKEHYPDFNSKLELYNAFNEKEIKQIFSTNEEFWKLMSTKEIKSTSKSKYIKIGSHGYFHNNIGNLTADNNLFELKTSKEYLENLIQKEINSIAYPDGSYSKSSVEIAQKLGLNYQLATDNFLFENEFNNHLIKTRRGVYEFGNGYNQLNNALKKY